MERQTSLKVERIRVQSLRNFLKLYFYAYVVRDERLAEGGRRRPRVFPGLRGAQRLLGGSKDKAEDYLRAIKILHEFLFAREGLPRPINDHDYRRLLEKVAERVRNVSKSLRGKPAGSELYRVLLEIAEDVRRTPASLTSNQCAKIIEEIGSVFV